MEYGLIGENLCHSYSKIIHELLSNKVAKPYSYELLSLHKNSLKAFMTKADFQAINVTLPYKCEVIPYLSSLDANSAKIGAVNTIVNHHGSLCGYNTDYSGFLYLLSHYKIPIANQKVMILGNGGASKAVNAVLHILKPSKIIIVKKKRDAGVIDYSDALAHHNDTQIVINTSPVGMFPDIEISPIDLSPYQHLHTVIDLIYNPLSTKLMEQAKERNILAINGMLMLVAQAKYAVELFLETEIPDTYIEPIYQTMMQIKKKENHPI